MSFLVYVPIYNVSIKFKSDTTYSVSDLNKTFSVYRFLKKIKKFFKKVLSKVEICIIINT